MITITMTSDAAGAQAFLVRIEGKIRNPRGLNADLADALKDKLVRHFEARDQEPNKLGGAKTGFWNKVAEKTMVGEVSAEGATVRVGVDTKFRIHLLGGKVKPVRGRFLTIPLVKEAHGLKVSDYEEKSGHKLFRLPGSKVLLEQTQTGDRSTLRSERVSMLTRSGRRVFQMGSGMRVRAVYALATEATIKPDPRALPPGDELAAVLREAGNAWMERELTKKGGKP